MEGLSGTTGYRRSMTDSPVDTGIATRTLPVSRLEFPVDWPPGHVAAYLLTGEEPVLIDSGMAGEPGRETLLEALDEHGYPPAEIEHLVLTHPHVDHLGQAATVIEAGDPTVYAPAGVERRFSRDTDDLARAVTRNATAAGLSGDLRDSVVERATESLRRDRSLLPSDAVDAWVEDGQTVEIGDVTLRAIHTPGHQADHLCYETRFDDERVLFSGDMAIKPFRSVAIHVGLDDGVEESIGAFYRALDRLQGLEIDRVFPGHGPTHREYADSLDRSVASLDRLLETTVESLHNGATTAAEIADRRRGRELVYLLPETVGALAHLEADGRVTSHLADGVRHYQPK